MCKLIRIIFILVISTRGYSKEIDVEIYDFSLDKDIVLNVNVYTGQYTTKVLDHFQSGLQVDKDKIKMCEFVEKTLNTDSTILALAFTNQQSNRKVNWKLFEDFRDLVRLEQDLKKQIEKKGFKVKSLTNLTNVLVEEITVKNIIWKSDALSLRNDNLLEKSEEELKRMLEVAPGRFSKTGYISDTSKYEFLYCDLLRGKVNIEVTVKGSQRKYYDEQITPYKVTLNREDISSISEKLIDKRTHISNVTKEKNGKENIFQIQLITTVGYLAQILDERNISLSDFESDEFFKLTSGLVNMTSGMPAKINQEKAIFIEKTLYRDAFNYKDTIPFTVEAKF